MVAGNTQDGPMRMIERPAQKDGKARQDDARHGGKTKSLRAFTTFRFNPAMRLRMRSAHLRDRMGAAFLHEFEQGRGFLWLPVGVGLGVITYFQLPREPMLPALGALFFLFAWLAIRMRMSSAGFAALIFLTAVFAGLTAAKLRTDLVVAPRLTSERTTTVTGWVEAAEATATGHRVILRVAGMTGISSELQPKKIRVAFRGDAGSAMMPGMGISLRARLRPPQGPVMPGGYDFARADYFAAIGAGGFAIGAPQEADLGPPPMALRISASINHVRSDLANRIRATLRGDTGAVAAALIVGMRRGISAESQEALRKAGLAHILAISGLHMALVAGGVYWAVRAFLALFPAIALRHPIRKWAAGAALAAGALYLVISGSGIATQRAFIMISVVFTAVLLGRPALNMRSVAVAALIVIALAPETVAGPSFQMSFAAVIALIAAYEWASARRNADPNPHRGSTGKVIRVVCRYLIALAATSLIAGLATAPFAAMHFHRLAPFGLLANLAAMPIVAFWVMPMAVISVIAIPFGIDPFPLTVMGAGIDHVLSAASAVAEITPANAAVVGRVPGIAIFLIAAGMLWLALWHSKLRLAGIPLLAAGALATQFAGKPDMLIASDGGLAAIRDQNGQLQLATKTRRRFVVENWLRADGDPREAKDPSLTENARCDPLGCILTGKEKPDRSRFKLALVKNPLAFEEDCRAADIVVTNLTAPRACGDHAMVFDRQRLAQTGAVAITFDLQDPDIDAEITPAIPDWRRPWHPPPAANGAAKPQ